MRQRPIYFFLLLFFLFAVPAERAHAQFWKEWFGGKEKSRPRPRVTQPVKKEQEKEEQVYRKRVQPEYPVSRIKTRYRIDILLPLYLQELVRGDTVTPKDKVPEKAATAIAFYEGVKLASDTLAALGYKLDVHVHDVTQENATPESLIKYRTLKGTDLIIGALPSSQLPMIADYAKEERVNFISATSPSDAGITDNIFFTMMQPGLESHTDYLRDVIKRKHPNRTVLLFYNSTSPGDSMTARYFRSGENYKEVRWNDTPVRQRIVTYLDSTMTNIIVMPILDINIAESMLRYLSYEFPSYTFEVFGMPSWKFMNSIRRADTLANIAVNFTTPFQYDPSSPSVQRLITKYRKTFGGRPGEAVFLGYETFYWHAYLLQKYGTVFNNRQSDIGGTAFTKLDVELQWDAEERPLYNENEHLYLYRYKGGSYMVE